MEISRNEDGAFVLHGLEGHLADFVRAIVSCANPRNDPAAINRLFPDPVTSPEEQDARDEWHEYIRPELAQHFDDAATLVEADLETMDERLVIPPAHIDAWINTLNQARLVLAARYEISEADMDRQITPVLENKRDIALFQIHFYGFIQECLIRGV